MELGELSESESESESEISNKSDAPPILDVFNGLLITSIPDSPSSLLSFLGESTFGIVFLNSTNVLLFNKIFSALDLFFLISLIKVSTNFLLSFLVAALNKSNKLIKSSIAVIFFCLADNESLLISL